MTQEDTKPELYKGALYGVRLDRRVLDEDQESLYVDKVAKEASKDPDLVVVRHGAQLMTETVYIGLPVESERDTLRSSDHYRNRVEIDLESLDKARDGIDGLVALLDSVGITDEVMKGPVPDHLKLYVVY